MSGDLSLPLAFALVGVGAAGAAAGFLGWGRPGASGLTRLATGAGLVAAAIAVGGWTARMVHAGHLPLFGTYESAWSLAVAVAVAALVAWVRWPDLRQAVWPPALAVMAGLLAHGLRFSHEAFPLTISERSWVVDVHAFAAWAAFGCLALNAGLALFLVVSERGGDRRNHALAYSLSLGFLLHTAMLATGSVYKFLLFGSTWSFDPVETLGFVAWMAYGTLLHMHLFAGWEGRKLASWCLGLFVILVVSYRGIVYFPAWSTYHIMDMDLRMHIESGSTADRS